MNIIVAFAKMQNGNQIRRILVQNGYEVTAVCTTGAQVLQRVQDLPGGIVICGYRFADMEYSELFDYLPRRFEMLLMASADICDSRERQDVMCLKMPLRAYELVQTIDMLSSSLVRRRRRPGGRAEGSRAEGGRTEGSRTEDGRTEGGRAEGSRAEGGRTEGGRAGGALRKGRTAEERVLIDHAKGILMERNDMTEEEAHRYLQKRSMDNGIGLVETAQMVLSLMKG